jgi:hypothetical protein
LATLLCLLWQVRKFLASKKEEAGLTRGEEILSPYLSVENDVFSPVLVHFKIIVVFVVLLFFFSGPSIRPVMMLGVVIEDCFILPAHMMHFIIFSFFFFFSGPCLAHQ